MSESPDIMILAKDVDYKRMVGRVCYLSEKIDGVPGIFEFGQPVMSRGNKPILSVPHINDIIQEHIPDNMVIIGELAIPGKPFKVSSGIIRRQTPQIDQGIQLYIWDVYFKDQMDLGFSARMLKAEDLLDHLCEMENGHGQFFTTIPTSFTVPDSPDDAIRAVHNHYSHLIKIKPYPVEGIMIRIGDEPYKMGRSWGMMRYVPKPTIDLRVCGFLDAKANKDMVFLGERYSKGVSLDAVGKIICEYKGGSIGVGPGCMTHKERRYYFMNPEKLIGKIIKIKYKPDDSYKALRQPTFVSIHHDKTTPDN